MLILSAFNSDYLQNPLKFLLEKFTSETIDIKYINKNLIGGLINLKSDLEKPKSYAILFRVFDFIEPGAKVDEKKLTEHLDLIVKQIIVLKHEKELPFLVFLCPSPSTFYINSQLENIEKSFIDDLNKNKIHTLTLADIQEKYRLAEFENPIEDDTHIPYTPEFYTAITCLLARKLHAIKQKPCKVIAVDCDNTLWTGVAADDGIGGIEFNEHNILLQKYLLNQQAQGKIICLCSKNEKQTVLDVFKKHEAVMPLKLDPDSKNKINWETKSKNIKELALELNVFPDSFRFIDDNPTEIDDVSQIPGVLCITMPQNSEEFKNNWAFDIDEHLIVTETDKNRTEFYKQTEIKAALATSFHDPLEYLRSPDLGQTIIISRIDSIDSENDEKIIQRVSQLSEKTNQFNLYPEPKAKEINEINMMVKSHEREIFIGSIQDNISAEDITAIAITSLDKNSLTINSFFVSCRVFCRGMEYEMLKHIAQFSQERDLKNIKLKFKKSEKNKPVSSFLNILSEATNKDPGSRSRFLLNFNSLELNEEFILTLSTQKIIELEVDSLIRASLNVSQSSIPIQKNTATSDSKDTGEKYLIELKNLTSSLDLLVKKFFIDKKAIQSIPELENKVMQICNAYLGKEGQDKSLVARGLNSLKATELRYYLYESEQVNITIPKLLCEKTTVFSLIEYIKGQEKITEKRSKNDDIYNKALPLSFQQQRIWFAEQQEQVNNSANYHMMACYKISKNIDIQRFEKACQKLIELYDVFGTSFSYQDGKLTQSILSSQARQLSFQIKKLKPETSLEEAIQLEMSKPWTMKSKELLIRFTIFEDKNYHIFLHIHHAIFDAVSLKNCLDTLSKLYQTTLTTNSSGFIDNPSPQYIKFIYDQQEKLADEVYQTAAFNFWKNTLSKIETVTTLPTDQAFSTFKPATEQAANRYMFSLLPEDLLALKALAKSTGVTCFSAINAVFALLIASYTYQKNITMITAANGRGGHPSFDKMVGFFVNLLVLQFDLEKNQRLDECLMQVNKKLLASQAFQDIPFNKIQEILYDQGVKDILLSPAFIYQSYVIPELRINDEIAELEIPPQPIIFDLRKTCRFGNFTLFAQENRQELTFLIEYAKDLFSTSFIESFAKNLLHTIKYACNNAKQALKDISVVCDEERNKLIRLGQGPKLNYAKDDNLVNRFKRRVEKYPNNIALSYGEIRLSYKEVDQQSTNLSHVLIQKGVKQGDYVGIYLKPDHLFFIAELAALKIGTVFIPLSKEDPYDRLKSIIEDAKIKFFIVDIVDNASQGLFDTDFKASTLIPIHSAEGASLDRAALPPLVKTLEDRFCILYTSGSTGKPKGVILQEKGIFRVVESPKFVEVLPRDKIAQTANQVFDAAQLECWLAWNNGACLILFDKETILNTSLLQNRLVAEKITHMWLTAGLFNTHANIKFDLFNSLKYLMVGGDVVYKDTISKILAFEKSPIIINGYGPTEASIFALTYTFDKQILKNFDTSPIGTPINNTTVKILTPFGMQAPMGAIGELSIAGDGVGCYLNLPELEKERFIGNQEQREFLTGDLVKYDSKYRKMMFERRANKQHVKINGNFVSLAEVRKNLSEHPAIKQVEIIIKKLDGLNQLIAFYILHEKVAKPTDQELRDFLNKRLPSYMLPTVYSPLDTFKMNANGKLDIKWLEEYQLKINDNDHFQKIEGDEKKVWKIFKEVLSNFPVDPNANFFEAGGSSLQAILLVNKINDTFKEIVISPGNLYKNPTVALLTKLIKNPTDTIKKTVLRLLKSGNDNLPAVVFIHPAGGGISFFNKLLEKVTFDNSCYGIEDPCLDRSEFKELSMEEMAGNYLSMIENEIREPFILGGYSFGGMLALEMAAQYERRSENLHLLGVVLFDTWVVAYAPDEVKSKLKKDVLIYCEEQRKKANVDEGSSEILDRLKKLCEHHQEIGFKFTPQTLSSTSVFLYKATQLNDEFSEMNRQDENNYLSEIINPKLFKKVEIDASHFDLLENSDNNCLAERFSNYIVSINQKICSKYSKLNKVSTLFPPLAEINNDPQFSCLKPRIKQ